MYDFASFFSVIKKGHSSSSQAFSSSRASGFIDQKVWFSLLRLMFTKKLPGVFRKGSHLLSVWIQNGGNKSDVNAVCLFIPGSASQNASLEPPHQCLPCPWATSAGPSRLHGNPFLMSPHLHITTAQRASKPAKVSAEREREKAKGRRN